METTSSKLKVEVAPSVLVWARETIGLPLEPAAKKLGIKPTTLRNMEAGNSLVAMAKLRQMAKVYDRPLVAFFLPEPPIEQDKIPDFRVLPEHESRAWSPALHAAYRRVVGQRRVALDLAATDDEPIPIVDLRLRPNDDEEQAGAEVRAWLSPPPLRVRDPYAVLNTWVRLIEDKGILVTQVSDVAIEEMRGFSIGEHPLPAIAINGSDVPRGKLFTLMHEFVHILLHRSALCDLEDAPAALDPSARRLEWFCNSVAATILMPREALLREPLVAAATSEIRWSEDELADLAGKFGVSAEAMLLRLVTLERASREFYRERRPLYLQRYREQRQNGKGFLTYYAEQSRNLGRRYITTVWQAYERGDISDPDLSTYLQTKPQNVPKLIQKVGLDQ